MSKLYDRVVANGEHTRIDLCIVSHTFTSLTEIKMDAPSSYSISNAPDMKGFLLKVRRAHTTAEGAGQLC